MKIIKNVVLASLLVILGGCANAFIKAYQGNLLPLEESAIVTCESAIKVTAIDGNRDYRLYSGGGLYYQDCIISLKPGTHTITFHYYLGNAYMTTSTRDITKSITVNKGEIYRIKYESHSGSWKPWIEKLQGEELEKQRKDIPIRIQNSGS